MKIVNFLIRHTGTIPVDRRAGCGRLRGRGGAGCAQVNSSPSTPRRPSAAASSSRSSRQGAARMAYRRAGADHPADRLGCATAVDQGPTAQAHNPREDPVHRRDRRADAARRHRRADGLRDARGDERAVARGPGVLRASRWGVLGAKAIGRFGAHSSPRRRRSTRPNWPSAPAGNSREGVTSPDSDRERRRWHAARRRRDHHTADPQGPCWPRSNPAPASCLRRAARRAGCNLSSTRLGFAPMAVCANGAVIYDPGGPTAFFRHGCCRQTRSANSPRSPPASSPAQVSPSNGWAAAPTMRRPRNSSAHRDTSTPGSTPITPRCPSRTFSAHRRSSC